MHCHRGSPKAMGSVNFDDLWVGSIASRNRLRFVLLSGGMFSIFGGFGEVLGRLQRAKKRFLGRFFGDAFFDRVFASILDAFLKARSLKNSELPGGKQRFSQNQRF